MTKDEVEKATILACEVGSTAYGTSVETSDIDILGVCIEPIENVVGFHTFEQFIHRDAEVRTGIKEAKSIPGDKDIKIYGLRKFMNLALKGNPSIIELLFIKNPITLTEVGKELQALAPHIVSRRCGGAYLGFAQVQKERMMGTRGQKDVNRPDLVEKYGFDTKFAGHVIRLYIQGIEIIVTHKLTMPIVGFWKDYIVDVRKGKYTLDQVVGVARELEVSLKTKLDDSTLPNEPNEALVEAWMIKTYKEHWDGKRK